jgi:hypothetical protein
LDLLHQFSIGGSHNSLIALLKCITMAKKKGPSATATAKHVKDAKQKKKQKG